MMRRMIIATGFLFLSSVILSGCSETEQRKTALLKQIEDGYDVQNAEFNLARIYDTQQKWDQAENYYDLSINFDPSIRDAQARTVKSDANPKAAAERYINQVSTSACESLRLGIAYQKQGLLDSALDCYNQAANLAPDSSRVYKILGDYYLSRGNKLLAKDNFVKSFKINPKQADVAGDLGRLGVVVEIPQAPPSAPKK